MVGFDEHKTRDATAESDGLAHRRSGAMLHDGRPAQLKSGPLEDNRAAQNRSAVLQDGRNSPTTPSQAVNNTGLPDQLKAGIESLSGMSMNHVKVHFNSNKPPLLNAHAYAQGSQIHIAPGQEKHLPHEAWHIVQQAQGRVRPTRQFTGVEVNDHPGLESEADVMGALANSLGASHTASPDLATHLTTPVHPLSNSPLQRKTVIDGTSGSYASYGGTYHETAGLHAYAYLDPNDQHMGSGPAPSALQWSMTDLKALTYGSMIKGHLINGQLGGPGLAANLFPITSQANSKHKDYAENHIKAEVTNLYNTSISVGAPSDWGVYYSVEVTGSARTSSMPDAIFTCEAYHWHIPTDHVDLTSPILKPVDIESRPAKGSTGSGAVIPLMSGYDAFGNSFNYSTNIATSLSFPTANLPSGWREKGKGKGLGGRDWSHVTPAMYK